MKKQSNNILKPVVELIRQTDFTTTFMRMRKPVALMKSSSENISYAEPVQLFFNVLRPTSSQTRKVLDKIKVAKAKLPKMEKKY